MTDLIAIQMMGKIRDLEVMPSAAAFADKFNEMNSDPMSTINYCRAHRLPLIDWKQKLVEGPNNLR